MSSLEDLAADVVARTTKAIIEDVFNASGDGGKKSFRVKNLAKTEIRILLELLAKDSLNEVFKDTRIVVASDAPADFPERFRADPEKSITYYRNNNSGGLVYIETKVESDEQGLKNLFTLRDINFLDESFDHDGFKVAEQLVDFSFNVVRGENSPSNPILSERLLEVLQHQLNLGQGTSLRKFVRFIVSAVMGLPENGILDSAEVDRLIGQSLIELDMFPDDVWNLERGRSGRRLQMNALHAQLAGSPSSDLDQDKLHAQIDKTNFKDADSQPLAAEEQSRWRSLCIDYLSDPSPDCRKRIPYSIFEQIFQLDLKGLKLGERVEKEIDDGSPERIQEFLGLDIKAGLDRRSAEEAQRFLDAEPESEEYPALRDLLSRQTRRMVEKVAMPTAERVENPILALAMAVRRIRDRNTSEGSEYVLDMRLGRQHEGNEASQGLVSFLYGGALRQISEELANGPGDMQLSVAGGLVQQAQPPSVKRETGSDGEDSGDEGEKEVAWNPVPLEFALLDKASGEELDVETAVEWFPAEIEYLALFWFAVAAEDRVPLDQLHRPSTIDGAEWVKEIAERRSSLKGVACKPIPKAVLDHPIIAELNDIRASFRETAVAEGLTEGLLNDTFDRWRTLVDQAKTEFVPDGAPDDRMNAFMASDCVLGFGGDGILMLPSHPLRLRWIAQYLAKSSDLAREALEGTLKLNNSNPEAYIGWLESLSPQQQPAIHCDTPPRQLYAAGESGWSEQYRPTETGGGAVTERRLASSLVREIVAQVERYLHALPYKTDGLSLLVLAKETSSIAADLVKSLRKGEFADLKLTIELVTPERHWPEATRLFDEVDSASRLSAGKAVQPPVELRLHDLPEFDDPKLDGILANLRADIAVVPAFLGGQVKSQEHTRGEASEIGTFDPLYDDPTHVHVGSEGNSVSVTMLPRNSDPALSAWSTLSVRKYRQHPVNQRDAAGTDFINMSVQFHHAAKVFERLHEVAHWVVTVERHITREQIEKLEARPDILVMRNKVGPGNRFSLVVSSNTGRNFIVGRLKRKIRHILGARADEEASSEFAERIYEDTRHIAPRLTLEALGVSRVTEEIIGLSVAREICREYAPVLDGIEVWLSLDDQPHWFTGPSAVRADMLRLVIRETKDGIDLELLVVESKLRGAGYDAHGAEQARSTMALLDEVFARDNARIDAELWREFIMSATDIVDDEAIRFHGTYAQKYEPQGKIPLELREHFRKGNLGSVSIGGLYSLCCYHDKSPSTKEEDDRDKRLSIIRSSSLALTKLLKLQAPEIRVDSPSAAPDEILKSEVAKPSEAETTTQEAAAQGSDMAEPSESQVTVAEEVRERTGQAVSPAPARGRLTSGELSDRYLKILRAFEEYGVGVRRAEDGHEYVEGPSSVLYRVKPAPGVDPSKVFDKANALKLVLGLAEHQLIRFTIGSGYVQIDVPKSDEDRYFVSANDLFSAWQHDPGKLSVPLGEDRFGEVVSLDFSSSDSPHLLIGGTTGSGKSEALNTILEGLTKYYGPEHLELLLIDPKGTELVHLEDRPHLSGRAIGWDDADAIALLVEAVDEMQRRYGLLKSARTRSIADFNAQAAVDEKLPWWVLVLDEYADLTSDPEGKKEIEKQLKRLAQKARAAGIHVIIATQKPSADVISTNLRSNLPAQLALRVKSSTESRVIMDDTGAEALNGKGDAFLKTVRGIVRVQCAKVE